MTKSNDRPRDSKTSLERRIHNAIEADDRTMPVSEAGVDRLEKKIGVFPTPTPGLKSPPDLSKPFVYRADRPVLQLSREIAGDLARAARDGKPIPAEIEEKMRRDRKAAEQDGKRKPQ